MRWWQVRCEPRRSSGTCALVRSVCIAEGVRREMRVQDACGLTLRLWEVQEKVFEHSRGSRAHYQLQSPFDAAASRIAQDDLRRFRMDDVPGLGSLATERRGMPRQECVFELLDRSLGPSNGGWAVPSGFSASSDLKGQSGQQIPRPRLARASASEAEQGFRTARLADGEPDGGS